MTDDVRMAVIEAAKSDPKNPILATLAVLAEDPSSDEKVIIRGYNALVRSRLRPSVFSDAS